MAIHLSRRARTDLEEIRDYTVESWGRDQWFKYFRSLNLAFESIEKTPGGGKDRSLFYPGMRSINSGRHVIFWKCFDTAGGAPVVLRIVHQRRNLPALVYYDDLAGGS